MPRYNHPPDLIKEIESLKNRIRTLENSPRAGYTTVDSGSVTIGAGGRLVAYDTDGSIMYEIGPQASDMGHTALRVYRLDGSKSFAVEGSTVADQNTSVFDNQNNTVFADDEAGGIARPWLAIPIVHNYAELSSLNITSGSFTEVDRAVMYQQQPKFTSEFHFTSTGAGNAQLTVTDLDAGTAPVVAFTHTFPTTEDVTVYLDAAVPNYNFGNRTLFSLQVQRTAGTGYVYGRLISLWGRQS